LGGLVQTHLVALTYGHPSVQNVFFANLSANAFFSFVPWIRGQLSGYSRLGTAILK
jgi:hypothetical protein